MLNLQNFRLHQNKLLPALLLALALVLAVWMLVRVVWLLAVPPVGEYPRLSVTNSPAGSGEGFTGRWFGGRAAGDTVANVPQQSLPKARLDAQLLGVIAVDNNAVANIAYGKNRDTIYRVGDTIINGITVEAIEAQRVVIREQGQLRQIELLPFGDKSEQGGVGVVLPVIPDQVTGEPAGGAIGSVPSVGTSIGAGVSTALLPDGTIALQFDTAASQRLAAFGVEQGEFVTEADGVAVAELLADRTRWVSLLERDTIEISLYRDGRSRRVSITPSAIAAQFLAGGAIGQ